MDQNLLKNEWIDELLVEVSEIFTEGIFGANMGLVETYHTIGCRIVKDIDVDDREKMYGQQIMQRIGKSLHIGKTTLYTCVKFAREYPTLDLLPLGKNITWTKVIKLLNPPKEQALPALPDKAYLKDVIERNLDFLIDNLTQGKKGVSLYLPYEYIDINMNL